MTGKLGLLVERVDLLDSGVDEKIVGGEGWEGEGEVRLVKLRF